MSAFSFPEPYVVTIDDDVAEDGSDILLLAVDGPKGLTVAMGRLNWLPIEKMTIVGQLVVVANREDMADDEDNAEAEVKTPL